MVENYRRLCGRRVDSMTVINAYNSRRQCKDETGQWSGYSYIKESPASVDRRLDANKRAERSYPEWRGHGYEVRKRGTNIVVTAGYVMAKLMRTQYREQCKGEERSVVDGFWWRSGGRKNQRGLHVGLHGRDQG